MKFLASLVMLLMIPCLMMGQLSIEWHSDSVKSGYSLDDIGFEYVIKNQDTVNDVQVTWMLTHDTSDSKHPNQVDNLWQDYMCEAIFVCWPYTQRSNTFTLEAGEEIEMYHHIWSLHAEDSGMHVSSAIIYQEGDSANTAQTMTVVANVTPIDTLFMTWNGTYIAIVDGDSFELFHGQYVPLSVSDVNSNTSGLGQNYPNPAHFTTNIPYAFSEGTGIIKVYDLLGNEIAASALRNQVGQLALNTGFPSGMYFYALWVDGHLIDRKRMQVIH
ncbi:MAG: T9SS type A sorting domain-containing protein [Cryomorphaceae bacterium]